MKKTAFDKIVVGFVVLVVIIFALLMVYSISTAQNSVLSERKSTMKNEITPEEAAQTVTGETPEEVTGYGLLDTGTGSMEKVKIVNGKLGDAINQVNPDGTTNMLAFVIIGPKRYEVKGDTLADC